MHSRFKFAISFGTMLLLSNSAVIHGQSTSGSALTGFGYTLPPAAVTAAPGQILMISVAGSRTLLSGPQSAIIGPTGRFPTQFAGFSVSLNQAQDPKQVAAQIIGVQQTACTTPQCTPITSITLEIPIELQVPSVATSLTVNDTGGALISVPLVAVTDSVHVLNSCDQTSVFESLFNPLPAPGCFPAVIYNGRLASFANPVRPGAEVAMYLYGVGISGTPGVTFTYDFRENAGGRSSNFAGGDVPVFIGGPQGVYQVNFIIPNIPTGTSVLVCDGQRIQSNLTVTVSGATSADAVRLCIQP